MGGGSSALAYLEVDEATNFASWAVAGTVHTTSFSKLRFDERTHREPFNHTTMGGRFNSVSSSARTAHPHGVLCTVRADESTKSRNHEITKSRNHEITKSRNHEKYPPADDHLSCKIVAKGLLEVLTCACICPLSLPGTQLVYTADFTFAKASGRAGE